MEMMSERMAEGQLLGGAGPDIETDRRMQRTQEGRVHAVLLELGQVLT